MIDVGGYSSPAGIAVNKTRLAELLEIRRFYSMSENLKFLVANFVGRRSVLDAGFAILDLWQAQDYVWTRQGLKSMWDELALPTWFDE